MQSSTIKLALELAIDTDPVAGRLRPGEHDAITFTGYIELMSLLEEARRIARTPTPLSTGDCR